MTHPHTHDTRLPHQTAPCAMMTDRTTPIGRNPAPPIGRNPAPLSTSTKTRPSSAVRHRAGPDADRPSAPRMRPAGKTPPTPLADPANRTPWKKAPESGGRGIRCPVASCHKWLANKTLLGRHIGIHEEARIWTCPEEHCNQWFIRKRTLQMHQLIHAGEKPYACSHADCTMRFLRPCDLSRHRRIHTGERPWLCPEAGCNKRFVQSMHMRYHLQGHIGREKNQVCPVRGCGRQFSRLHNMLRHMSTHSPDRPYSCPVAGCGLRFRRLCNQQRHTRTHSGDKPFHCPVEGCERRFPRRQGLNHHLAVHKKNGDIISPPACGSPRYGSRAKKPLAVHSPPPAGQPTPILPPGGPCPALSCPLPPYDALPPLPDDVISWLAQQPASMELTHGADRRFWSNEPFERWMDPGHFPREKLMPIRSGSRRTEPGFQD